MKIWKTLQQWSKLVWLIVFIFMGVILMSSMHHKRNDMAREWVIDIDPMRDGGYLLTEAEVKQMLPAGKDGAAGILDDLEVDKMEALLRNHPHVARADVFVDARNRLSIRIEQPELLVRVIDQRGAHYYISDEGKRTPVSRHHAPRIPVVTGVLPLFADSLAQQPGHVFAQLMALAAAIRQDEFASALVEQIDCRKGTFTIVPKMGRFRFLLGADSSFDHQLALMRTFYRDILPASGWDTYKMVDLRYKGQIVCKKSV